MKKWHYLTDAFEVSRSHLARFIEGDDVSSSELVAAANAVFGALWPVVRPLSVSMKMAAWEQGFFWIDPKVPVPISYWHLREMHPLTCVVMPEWIDPHKDCEEAIPELTLQALADWLACAHAQQLPEGYFPVLETLNVHASRVRLLEDPGPYAELVYYGPQAHSIPIEKREDGLWVSGPRQGMGRNPPIEIELCYVIGGRLHLDVTVYWSPWFEAEFAEAELLKTCLRELEKQGWEAD